MSLSFKYWADPNGQVKPIIPLVFVDELNNEKLISEGTLVDSGADVTTISEALAMRLNLNISPTIYRTKGVGGEAKVKHAEGYIILSRGADAYKLRVPMNIVLPGETSLSYPLLGRFGIFKHFDISFRERKLSLDFVKKSIDIEKIPLPKQLQR